MTEQLEDELHELDKRIDALRRRIWMVHNGLVQVDDVEAELAKLDAEYRQASEQFIDTYRRWSQQE